MKRELLLLLSGLLLSGICTPKTLSAQASELYGSHTVSLESGVVVIDISEPVAGRGASIHVEENSFTLHRMSVIDIIGFLVGKIEPCLADEACNFRRKKGVPYLFHDLEGHEALQTGTIQISASCSQCSTETIKEITLDFLAERLSLDIEATQVPTYSVCQDVPSFLAHFHSGEDNFSNGQVHQLDYVGDYLEIRNATLRNAVRYLAQRTNSLFKFDPDCSYYSLAYTKPFRILKEGNTEDVIADFAAGHFLKIEKVEGEYWGAFIIRPL